MIKQVGLKIQSYLFLIVPGVRGERLVTGSYSMICSCQTIITGKK